MTEEIVLEAKQAGLIENDNVRFVTDNNVSLAEISRMQRDGNISTKDIADAIRSMLARGEVYVPDLEEKAIEFGVLDTTPNDKMLSEVFSKCFENRLRYNATAKCWYYYDGSVWKPDIGDMFAERYAKAFIEAVHQAALTIQNEKILESYIKQLVKYLSHKYRAAMIADAREINHILHSDLDKNKDLFNCQNGTYNLRTKEFTYHSSNDLLTKISNVYYNPNIRSSDWETFVRQIMNGNDAKIRYLQKAVGLSLTAENNLETCWILYGSTTRNGKGTFVETIAYMLGNTTGYAMTALPESLAQKDKNPRQASGDVARLDGCRFLNVSEPPQKMIFDSAKLKSMLGRDTIPARHLYEREFEFTPVFKLFINTNYLPHVDDDTLFSSGRINVITFDVHFEGANRDPYLKDKLRSKDNITGLFNWALEGLEMYRVEGLEPPAEVREAVAEYRKNSDKTALFFEERMKIDERNTIAGSDVYEEYSRWCRDNGLTPNGTRTFYEDLRRKGLMQETGTVKGINGKSVTVRNVVKNYSFSDNSTPLESIQRASNEFIHKERI